MSVINKVLRDLDQRQSVRRAGDVANGASVVRHDVARWSGIGWPHWALGVLLLLLALAMGAYLAWTSAEKKHVAQPVAAPSPDVWPAAPVARMPASAEPPPIPVPERVNVPEAPAPVPTATSSPALVRAPKITPAVTPAVQPAAALAAESVAAAPKVTPAPTAAPRPAVAVPAGEAAVLNPVAPRPAQQAAQEALAQAQALWQLGNQAGALELVRSVIARLQRSPDVPVDALAAAAREYVRMALALQRAPDALALLVQLEAPLAKVADIWALRGNVAQRLGLHAQAVHAYMNALELKPGQARWMLAAAVSLAAQGQKVSAADWAEKAQRAGFLPADVANYLHQLGVDLRAP